MCKRRKARHDPQHEETFQRLTARMTLEQKQSMALNMLMYPCHRANECNWSACRPDCDGPTANRNNRHWVRAEYSKSVVFEHSEFREAAERQVDDDLMGGAEGVYVVQTKHGFGRMVLHCAREEEGGVITKFRLEDDQ
jgi:hypothetical protein